MLGSQKGLCEKKSKERNLRLGSAILKKVLEIPILITIRGFDWFLRILVLLKAVLKFCCGNKEIHYFLRVQTNKQIFYLGSENCKYKAILKASDN